MNDWDYHKKEFTHLGGIINNLTCREGENGRGVFRQGRPVKPKIICPPNLLTKLDDIVLVRGELRLNKNSNHSREARDFIESYYEKFSWGDTGKKEAATFLYEITQLPINAKKFLLDNKFLVPARNCRQKHSKNIIQTICQITISKIKTPV